MKQTEAVLKLLRERGNEGVTPLDALDIVGSFRLGARIFDLRAQGFDIEPRTVETHRGARLARYILHEQAQTGLSL